VRKRATKGSATSAAPAVPRARKKRAPKPKKARAEAEPAASPRPPDLLRARGLVAIAEVARPHGLIGELRLKVYNPDSDLLRRRRGSPRVLLVMPDHAEREIAVTASREVDKALLVRLEGIDDRNAAELLRGARLCVPRASLPPPDEGEFYAWDIEGARAVLTSGETVGLVRELASYPTCEVLVVERDGKLSLEIPMIEAYVARVDVAAGLVELVTVEGLE
jgi:16S rRNA processing protein RimM